MIEMTQIDELKKHVGKYFEKPALPKLPQTPDGALYGIGFIFDEDKDERVLVAIDKLRDWSRVVAVSETHGNLSVYTRLPLKLDYLTVCDDTWSVLELVPHNGMWVELDKLRRHKTGWQAEKATEKQLSFLRSLGYTGTAPETKGEAGLLISQYTKDKGPYVYKGITFQTRLERQWAAFFDLAEWRWQYRPETVHGWTPEFRVEFGCGHSECPSTHTLLVEVKPYQTIYEFDRHEGTKYPYGFNNDDEIPADASAVFGANPSVSAWEMCHGAGSAVYDISAWIDDCQKLWREAGLIVQPKGKGNNERYHHSRNGCRRRLPRVPRDA